MDVQIGEIENSTEIETPHDPVLAVLNNPLILTNILHKTWKYDVERAKSPKILELRTVAKLWDDVIKTVMRPHLQICFSVYTTSTDVTSEDFRAIMNTIEVLGIQNFNVVLSSSSSKVHTVLMVLKTLGNKLKSLRLQLRVPLTYVESECLLMDILRYLPHLEDFSCAFNFLQKSRGTYPAFAQQPVPLSKVKRSELTFIIVDDNRNPVPTELRSKIELWFVSLCSNADVMVFLTGSPIGLMQSLKSGPLILPNLKNVKVGQLRDVKVGQVQDVEGPLILPNLKNVKVGQLHDVEGLEVLKLFKGLKTLHLTIQAHSSYDSFPTIPIAISIEMVAALESLLARHAATLTSLYLHAAWSVKPGSGVRLRFPSFPQLKRMVLIGQFGDINLTNERAIQFQNGSLIYEEHIPLLQQLDVTSGPTWLSSDADFADWISKLPLALQFLDGFTQPGSLCRSGTDVVLDVYPYRGGHLARYAHAMTQAGYNLGWETNFLDRFIKTFPKVELKGGMKYLANRVAKQQDISNIAYQ